MKWIQVMYETLAAASGEPELTIESKTDFVRCPFCGKRLPSEPSLAAADALALKAQQLSDGARIVHLPHVDAEFVIDPQDLAELDAALRQYRREADETEK